MRERDRTLSIQKKKLLKATTFSVVLLSVALMVLSGAVSAINLNVNSTQMNVNNNGQNQPLNTDDSSADIAGENDNGVPVSSLGSTERMYDYGQQHRGVVVFNNGMNFNNGGHSTKPTYGSQGADDFSFNTGGVDVCVSDFHAVYIFTAMPSNTNTICVEFYEDDGTGTRPGDLYAGPFCVQWGSLSKVYLGLNWGYPTYEIGMIFEDVCFPGCGEKFWVSSYYNYGASAYWGMHTSPINGHMGVWKGTYWGVTNWIDTSTQFGSPYDWTFQLTQASQHDVSVIKINTGEFCVCLPIEVVVTNYGKFDETNVPVHVTVKQIYATYAMGDFFTQWTQTGGTGFSYVTTPYHSASYALQYKEQSAASHIQANTVFDFAIACNPYISFWMWHDTYGSDDYLQVTSNGMAFGDQYYRNNGETGWVQHFVELPAGTTQVGFYGASDAILDAYPIFIDDVEVFDMAFDETKLVDVDVGEEVTVEFSYCPCQWENVEDINLNVVITACTEMETDETPANDCLTANKALYLPFFHDVGGIDIQITEEECLDFSVSGTIANFGQFEECCFKVYMDIWEFLIGPWSTTPLYQQDFQTYTSGWPFYTLGWQRTSTNWGRYYTSILGLGYSYTLRMYWSPSVTNTRAYMQAGYGFSTAGLYELQIKFRHFYDAYSTPITLSVDTSNDGLTWTPGYQVVNPTGNIGPIDVTFTTKVTGPTTYLSFAIIGSTFNADYWYIDNIVVQGRTGSLGDNVYSEWFCVDTIDPCQTLDVDFATFTPPYPWPPCESILYKACIKTALCDPMDEQPVNDEYCEFLTVDFNADVVAEITSPEKARSTVYANDAYPGYKMVTFDTLTPGTQTTLGPYTGAGFLAGGTWYDDIWWGTDYYAATLYQISTVDGSMTPVGGSGTAYNGITVDPTDGQMYGLSSYNLYKIDMGTGAQTLVGSWGSSYLMIDGAFDADGQLYGHDIVTDSMYKIDKATGAATLLGSTGQSCNYAQGMEYDFNDGIMYAMAYTTGGNEFSVNLATGQFTLVGSMPGEIDGDAIVGGSDNVNLPKPDIWITCGEFEICATITNDGVFDYVDDPSTPCEFEALHVYWQLDWYYLTDPCEDPTIETVLTGEDTLELLCGESKEYCVNYEYEETGVYQLIFWVVADPDCDVENNIDTFNIGVDCCDPITEHTLTPIMPDGCNNWYKQDVTVKITGYDPLCPDPCYGTASKIAEIHYKINGVETVKEDDEVTFKIKDEGVNLIEYWGVDKAGNVEDKFTFEIAIDKTDPSVDLIWEKIEDGTVVIKFTAVVFDATSGIDKVEFFIGSTPETPKTAPPFVWEVPWQESYKTTTFKAVVYDSACNDAEDTVFGGDIPFAKVYANMQSMPHSINIPRTSSLNI